MSKQKRFRLVLAESALRDLVQVRDWSIREFGIPAAQRYGQLIRQALKDITKHPERPGATALGELAEGVMTYHLQSSRQCVKGERVKRPRHFLLYRVRGDVVELARVLHDSRDLLRHIPDEYRTI